MTDDRLREIVAENFGVTSEAVDPGFVLTQDSLSLTEVIVRVEAEVGYTISDAEADTVKTFSDLRALMGRKAQ